MEKKPHIMLIEAPFYQDIIDEMVKGALIVLNERGVSFERFQVPGALEIPHAISYGIKMKQFHPARRRFDGYIALGCIIKGETHHFDVVCNETNRAMQDLATQYGLALGNGVLTVYDEKQAWERARVSGNNKGGAAAVACLDMIALKAKFGLFPRD